MWIFKKYITDLTVMELQNEKNAHAPGGTEEDPYLYKYFSVLYDLRTIPANLEETNLALGVYFGDLVIESLNTFLVAHGYNF